MNDNAVKTTPSGSNTGACKPSKKSKKKRRKNKFKFYNLRWKKHKKESSFAKPLSKLPPESGNREIMSNWYWSNYQKALEWRDKQELAQWKAYALALREENKYLLQIINQMRPGMSHEVSVRRENFQRRKNRQDVEVSASSVDNSAGTEDYDEEEQEVGDDDDIEFEMSEEMIQFFRESIRHKEDLKKLKEEESVKKAEEEIKEMQMNKLKRSAEMQLLYGEGASMIIGMETAVQLSYEKFCETKSPKYWPNLPFRL